MTSTHNVPVLKGTDLGLKILVDPQDVDDIAADIVTTHGIGADPRRTWVSLEHGRKVNWLSDKTMLPAVCPKARILSYQYNSVWIGDNPPRQSFHSIAKDLLYSLVRARKECRHRPIIFVSHCLGGLIAQCAYNMADTNRTDFPDIHDSTTGFLSLGTPYQGHGHSVEDSIYEIFRKIGELQTVRAQTNLIGQLVRDNDMLVTIVEGFTRKINTQANPPRIFCFYEQRETCYGDIANVETKLEFVVGEMSGILNGHENQGLSLDHFGINKFAHPDDNHFLSVSDRIREMVDFSAQLLEKRGVSVDSPQRVTRVQSLPISSGTVPFREENNFVNRGGILQRLDDKYHDRGRVVLTGEPGVGKTHIEVAYASWFTKESPLNQVHWVNASTAEQFELSYKCIATSLHLAYQGDAVEAVYRFLQQDSEVHWLMVVDGLEENADLTATNPAQGGRSLLDFIPECHNGRVLISTRSKRLAHRVVKHKTECIIEVPPLDTAGAAQLLLGQVSKDAGRLKAATNVMSEIGRSPVALTLAYNYHRHIVKSNLTIYLTMINSQPIPQHDEPKRKGVLEGVYRAWLPSFNHLRQYHSQAADLLLLMGTLDLQIVPTDFIASAVDRGFKIHVTRLVQYGMVEPALDRTAVGVTALIRQCVQSWLVEHDEKSVYEEMALTCMRKAVCSTKEEYRPRLHPCALAVLRFPAMNTPGTKQARADLLFKVGLTDLAVGRNGSAVHHLEECLSLRQNNPGVPQTLIQETLAALDRAKQAKPPQQMSRDAFVLHLRSLGPENPNNVKNDSLPSLHATTHDHTVTAWIDAYNRGINLSRSCGSSIDSQSQALEHYLTAMRIALPLLGPTDQFMLRILGSVALTKYILGHQEEGREILRVVYAEQEALLGSDHADTVNTKKNLAQMMQSVERGGVTKEVKALPPATSQGSHVGRMIGGHGVQQNAELYTR
ncbi:hypothetical protein QBC43DRAFT_124693 [Cladorrhinum sp. PSN259]|nr:hypothetical protein QBC43DRAFT_124693 [Cladorrhinum sp. PSN259]